VVNFYEMGQRIYAERKRLNMSREKLAEHLGLSVYYIGQLERGGRKMSFDTLIKLSDCLHVSLDYLVRGQMDANNIMQDELHELLRRCSSNEVSMFTDILKAIMPYAKPSK
jgi:transcriptional regulator with XRE-family HTH domain